MRSSIIRLWLFLPLIACMSCAPRDDSVSDDGPAPESSAQAKGDKLPIPDSLLPRINSALQNVESRDLLTTHGFWTVFHGILGLGPDVTLRDPQTGVHVNALERICTGEGIRGLEFRAEIDGLDVVTMPGSGVGQGHQDQFVAEMVEWGVPATRPVMLNGKHHTFADFFHYSKMRSSVTKNQELSWAIVIVGAIYGTDHAWTNTFGEKITYEDIVRYELNQPIDTAACGGTHRLWGLTWAYQLHRTRGGQPTGVWKEVLDKTTLYKTNARKFQHADGSFSTAYVSKAEDKQELPARIASTGHVLEWLALELSDDELRQPWVQDAASALSVMILENQNNPIDGGALYHAVHGLYILRARVFNVPGPRGLHVAATAK
jgi:hypothetical protein